MARVNIIGSGTMAPRKPDLGAETSRLTLNEDAIVSGFVVDADALERRFTVEVLLDGLVVATSYAGNFVPELAERGLGDGAYGFAVNLEPHRLITAGWLEARLANMGTPVGKPIDLTKARDNRPNPLPTAELRWLGGVRFAGWIDDTADTILEAAIDGEAVAQFRAAAWTRIDEDSQGQGGRNVRAFDFHLPGRFANGRVYNVSLRRDSGEPLATTAVFVAFPDGLAATIAAADEFGAERLRGKLFDQLIPASLPLSDYAAWRNRFPVPAPRSSRLQLAVVIAGDAGSEQTLATLQAQSHAYWSAGMIEGATFALDSEALNEFLTGAAADAEAVVVTMAGMAFAPDALARIAAAFDNHPDADVLYGDLDFLANDGQLWPLAFPAFDYERMLEQGYCAHLFALRRQTALAALRTGPENLYRLFNASLDRTGPQQATILHLPGALGTLPRFDIGRATSHLVSATRKHLVARGTAANVTPREGDLFPAVHVGRFAPRLDVTVVIPTRDRVSLLRTCLDSIAGAVERSRADILVIDNDSTDPETLAYLAELPQRGIRSLRIEGHFNFARLNNRAASAVDTEFLCLLNNDIEATSDDWLEEMLGRLAETDVGAVGALLTWPGGVVQHGGVVLGVNFAATHAFTDRLAEDPGYLDLLHVAHECSALTAACLVTRRADYLAVGGMDEVRLGVAFNDVDYCLRLREAGKRIVFTPHARLIHAESVSRGSDDRADRRDRFERELNVLRARWGQFLIDDPSYNPQLSRDGLPYGALAWPPASREARFNARPHARDLPPGF